MNSNYCKCCDKSPKQCRVCLRKLISFNQCNKCNIYICLNCIKSHKCGIRNRYAHFIDAYVNMPETFGRDRNSYLVRQNSNKRIKYNSYMVIDNSDEDNSDEDNSDEDNSDDNNNLISELEELKVLYPEYDFQTWLDGSYERQRYLISKIIDIKNHCDFNPDYTPPVEGKWNISCSSTMTNTFVITRRKANIMCNKCNKIRLRIYKTRWKFLPGNIRCITDDIYFSSFEQFKIYMDNL